MKTSTLALGAIAVSLAALYAVQWDEQWSADESSLVVGAAERENARNRPAAQAEQAAAKAGAPEAAATPAPASNEPRASTERALPAWMQDTLPPTAPASTERSLIPMQSDVFRTAPKAPPPAVVAPPPPPTPTPQPRFTVIGRVIDGGVRQVIIQDTQRVVTLGMGQQFQGFVLEAVEDNVAVFSGKSGEGSTRHRLEYGKVPSARAATATASAPAQQAEAADNPATVN
jgi:hypothetical protein